MAEENYEIQMEGQQKELTLNEPLAETIVTHFSPIEKRSQQHCHQAPICHDSIPEGNRKEVAPALYHLCLFRGPLGTIPPLFDALSNLSL